MYYLLKMYRTYDCSSLSFLRANADMNTLWKDMHIKNGDYTKKEIEKINLDYKKSKNIKVLNYISHRTGKSIDDVFSFLQENRIEDFSKYDFSKLYSEKKKSNEIINERLFHFSNLSFLQRIKIKKEIKEKIKNGEFLKNNPDIKFMEIANVIKDFPQKYIEQMINNIDNLDFSYDVSEIGFRIPFVEEERMDIKDKSIEFRKYLKMHLEGVYLKKEFIIPESPELIVEKRKRL